MKLFFKICYYSILILFGLGCLFPLFWMIILSLKSSPEGLGGFFNILSAPITLKNYVTAFTSDDFSSYFLNSLFVSSIVTAGNLLFCYLCAYALSRRNFKTKPLIMASILGVLIIPPHVVMIPLYKMMVGLGWINTYWALIVPWMVTPFGIFLVKNFLDSIPTDMEDAARMDGAGELTVIFKVAMPISTPVLTALGIYVFLSNWNSFLFPFLFTNDSAYRTLPVGLAFYLGKQSIDWGGLMAGAAISSLPVLILFVFFQKKIISGLTAGALKE